MIHDFRSFSLIYTDYDCTELFRQFQGLDKKIKSSSNIEPEVFEFSTSEREDYAVVSACITTHSKEPLHFWSLANNKMESTEFISLSSSENIEIWFMKHFPIIIYFSKRSTIDQFSKNFNQFVDLNRFSPVMFDNTFFDALMFSSGTDAITQITFNSENNTDNLSFSIKASRGSSIDLNTLNNNSFSSKSEIVDLKVRYHGTTCKITNNGRISLLKECTVNEIEDLVFSLLSFSSGGK